MLPNAGSYCKVACFWQNTFGQRLDSDVGITDDVLAQKDRVNVAAEALSRRSTLFRSLTSDA